MMLRFPKTTSIVKRIKRKSIIARMIGTMNRALVAPFFLRFGRACIEIASFYEITISLIKNEGYLVYYHTILLPTYPVITQKILKALNIVARPFHSSYLLAEPIYD